MFVSCPTLSNYSCFHLILTIGMTVKIEINHVSELVKSTGSNEFPEKIHAFLQAQVGIDHCLAIYIGPGETEPALLFTYGLVSQQMKPRKSHKKASYCYQRIYLL